MLGHLTHRGIFFFKYSFPILAKCDTQFSGANTRVNDQRHSYGPKEISEKCRAAWFMLWLLMTKYFGKSAIKNAVVSTALF